MKYVLATAPAIEPVTLAEAKIWARQDIDIDDALFTALNTAARQSAEQFLDGRVLISQDWKVYLDLCEFMDAMTCRKLVLPKRELISVASIRYRAASDQALADFVTWDASNYLIDTVGGRILLAQAGSLPTVYGPYESCVEITFKAGYGDAADKVPEPIKSAIKVHIAAMYENRAADAAMPDASKLLLTPYRVMSV